MLVRDPVYTAKITISAALAKKVFWRAYKYRLLWKHAKFYGVILLFGAGGFSTFQFIASGRVAFSGLYLLFPIWAVLIVFSYSKSYYILKNVNEGYSFDVKLDEEGVETSDQKISWDEYHYFVEFDEYLEIHGPKNSISFVPKTAELHDILEYVRKRIPTKQSKRTASPPLL